MSRVGALITEIPVQLEDFLEMSFRDLKPEDMLPPTEELDLTELIRQNIDDEESDSCKKHLKQGSIFN